jgi:hypothetical protein
MKLVRYLKKAELMKAKKEKQPNGAIVNTFETIKTYRVQVRELNDEVSATVYGANISKMKQVSTALKDLEEFLTSKLDNKEDNVSLYYLKIDGTRYGIKAVQESGVTIERYN